MMLGKHVETACVTNLLQLLQSALHVSIHDWPLLFSRSSLFSPRKHILQMIKGLAASTFLPSKLERRGSSPLVELDPNITHT